jgi:hypothetical protein
VWSVITEGYNPGNDMRMLGVCGGTTDEMMHSHKLFGVQSLETA